MHIVFLTLRGKTDIFSYKSSQLHSNCSHTFPSLHFPVYSAASAAQRADASSIINHTQPCSPLPAKTYLQTGDSAWRRSRDLHVLCFMPLLIFTHLFAIWDFMTMTEPGFPHSHHRCHHHRASKSLWRFLWVIVLKLFQQWAFSFSLECKLISRPSASTCFMWMKLQI